MKNPNIDRFPKRLGPGQEVVQSVLTAARALELRKAGKSYDAIASELGLSVSYVAQMVRNGLQKARKVMVETAQEVIDLELSRLDSMLEIFQRRANGGDVKAAEMVLKIMERRSKYLGLDQAVKIDVKQSAGELDLSMLSDEELDAYEAITVKATVISPTGGQEADQVKITYLEESRQQLAKQVLGPAYEVQPVSEVAREAGYEDGRWEMPEPVLEQFEGDDGHLEYASWGHDQAEMDSHEP